MPAGEDRRSARAGDALGVRRRVFDWVQEGRPDLLVGCGVSGATPDREDKPQIFRRYCSHSPVCVQGITSKFYKM